MNMSKGESAGGHPAHIEQEQMCTDIFFFFLSIFADEIQLKYTIILRLLFPTICSH